MSPVPPQPDHESLLTALILARESGDVAEVERLLAQHAHEAPSLRRALARLEAASLLPPPRGDQALPERLGEFRILHRIGGGGMGVVALADQPSLRRKVAVKLVRPELMLSPIARERFQREVETIAGLQHPGIVPVLAVGQHRGVPYFAMEYVPGCSLQEVLVSVHGRRPGELDGSDFAAAIGAASTRGDRARAVETWWQAIVRTLATVAATVAHVHARGIVHRDLKPSNIMVRPDGHALLLDFGLAHVAAEQRLTRAGGELGSLPYMSPEQVGGEALDERTDVYSLGVTLYQLLALRLPFADDNDARLRAAIVAGAARPLRDHDPRLPRDLQTVVTKAMDVDRSRRYASMAAMRDDLQAVLEGSPIAATPNGLLVRLWRWRGRHPFAAGMLVAAASLPLLAPLALLWLQSERAATLREARDVATADFAHAREAITMMWEHAAALDELRDPASVTLRQRLQDEMLTFFTRLRSRHSDDADLRIDLVTLHRTNANAAWRTGRMDDADAAVAAGRALLAEVAGTEHAETLRASAQLTRIAARIAMERGAFADAEAELHRLRHETDRLLTLLPADLGVGLLSADTLNMLSHVRGNQGRPAEKLSLLHDALAARRELIRRHPADAGVMRSVAMQCTNLADTLSASPTEAENACRLYRESLSLLDAADTLDGGRRKNEAQRAETHTGLGIVLTSMGATEEALRHFALALQVQQALCDAEPQQHQYHYELARTAIATARAAAADGDTGAAVTAADIADAATARALRIASDNAWLLEQQAEIEQLRRDLTGAAEASARRQDR